MRVPLIPILASFLLLVLSVGEEASAHSCKHRHHRHHCPCDASSSSSSSSEEEHHHHGHGHHCCPRKKPKPPCPCANSTEPPPTPTPSSTPGSSASTPPGNSSTSPASSSPTPPSSPRPSSMATGTPSQCTQCSLATLTLTPGSTGQGTATPVSSGVNCCTNDCSTTNVTCTATGGQVFMQFNNEQGGPLEPIGSVVTATLNCNQKGQWVYAPDATSRVITEVNCVLT